MSSLRRHRTDPDPALRLRLLRRAPRRPSQRRRRRRRSRPPRRPPRPPPSPPRRAPCRISRPSWSPAPARTAPGMRAQTATSPAPSSGTQDTVSGTERGSSTRTASGSSGAGQPLQHPPGTCPAQRSTPRPAPIVTSSCSPPNPTSQAATAPRALSRRTPRRWSSATTSSSSRTGPPSSTSQSPAGASARATTPRAAKLGQPAPRQVVRGPAAPPRSPAVPHPSFLCLFALALATSVGCSSKYDAETGLVGDDSDDGDARRRAAATAGPTTTTGLPDLLSTMEDNGDCEGFDGTPVTGATVYWYGLFVGDAQQGWTGEEHWYLRSRTTTGRTTARGLPRRLDLHRARRTPGPASPATSAWWSRRASTATGRPARRPGPSTEHEHHIRRVPGRRRRGQLVLGRERQLHGRRPLHRQRQHELPHRRRLPLVLSRSGRRARRQPSARERGHRDAAARSAPVRDLPGDLFDVQLLPGGVVAARCRGRRRRGRSPLGGAGSPHRDDPVSADTSFPLLHARRVDLAGLLEEAEDGEATRTARCRCTAGLDDGLQTSRATTTCLRRPDIRCRAGLSPARS